MSITNLLAQGFNPLPAEIQQNALMAGQQMQERRMRNALLQQQMQAAQEERAAQQRNALMMQDAINAIPSPQMQASQQALAGGGGPTVANAARMPAVDPRLQALHGLMQASGGKLVSPVDYLKTAMPEPEKARDVVVGNTLVRTQGGKATPLFTAPKEEQKPNDYRLYELSGAKERGLSFDQWDLTRRRAASTTVSVGGGSGQIDDRAGLSQKLGVPVADRDPFAGMSPKDQATFKRSLYTAADKKLTEADEGVASARNMARDAQRFLELQSKVSMQGPVAGRVFAISSEAQEMDAITDKITPQMRQPGSGATSDFDARMFRNSTVSRVKNEAANTAIANGIVLNAKNSEDRAQFMRDYLTVNGHLDGADRQWKRYADANPIFDPQSPNEPKINPKRVPYQQFFGGGAQPAQPAQAGGKTVVRTGTMNNRKVVQYSDGTTAYAD